MLICDMAFHMLLYFFNLIFVNMLLMAALVHATVSLAAAGTVTLPGAVFIRITSALSHCSVFRWCTDGYNIFNWFPISLHPLHMAVVRHLPVQWAANSKIWQRLEAPAQICIISRIMVQKWYSIKRSKQLEIFNLELIAHMHWQLMLFQHRLYHICLQFSIIDLPITNLPRW